MGRGRRSRLHKRAGYGALVWAMSVHVGKCQYMSVWMYAFWGKNRMRAGLTCHMSYAILCTVTCAASSVFASRVLMA